jgi:prepilin-type N-terminal cleavage/methylation domain-containing protein
LKKNNSKLRAFSLIELSVVIIVVGILIAGVMQGRSILKKAKLSTAQNLTKSSPVSNIKDLILWYETSLEDNFISSERVDKGTVSTWYDRNPQSITKNNASSSSSNKPKFYENVINGIPTVRFDGSNDFMTLDGSNLLNNSLSIFVVEQRRSAMNILNSAFIGGNDNKTGENLYMGYNQETQMKFAFYNCNGLGYDNTSIFTYSSPTPRMHTATYNNNNRQVYYYVNGGETADDSIILSCQLSGNSGFAIGRTKTNSSAKYFNGDIAEIIIFLRDLKKLERQQVESYLSQKYGITIS